MVGFLVPPAFVGAIVDDLMGLRVGASVVNDGLTVGDMVSPGSVGDSLMKRVGLGVVGEFVGIDEMGEKVGLEVLGEAVDGNGLRVR